MPTPTEKGEAFQFPAQPTVPKSEASSQVLKANDQSNTAQGSQQQHTSEASSEQDHANQQAVQQIPPSEKINQQTTTQVNQQQAKPQPVQQTGQGQTVPGVNTKLTPESTTQVSIPQQANQQPIPQATKTQPVQHTQPGNQQETVPSTQSVDPSLQQVKQTPNPPQSTQPVVTQEADTKQVLNQTTPQQTNHPASQTNQQAASEINQQPAKPTTQLSDQSSPKPDLQPQANQATVPNQVNQQNINHPTSFPKPLEPQAQETKTKPPSKTPTEVRGKKKQFQVQVVDEPQNGAATDLPIAPAQPVNSNALQNPPINTSVAQGPPTNTTVPKNTKASPVEGVVSQINTVGTVTTPSNTDVLTDCHNQVPSSLSAKQTTTKAPIQSQMTDDIQNVTQGHNVAVQCTQTPTISPTQQLKPQAASTPARPESLHVPVALPTQTVATQDTNNTVQQAASTQTSIEVETKTETSISTETSDLSQESVHVQTSTLSSHPPIHIPISLSEVSDESFPEVTSDAVSEKSQNSQKSENLSEDQKTPKQDDVITQLTSSIQTQTSFDKIIVTREQAKKPNERRTIEKSSSDEQPTGCDDSDGSSEKSLSRQSSENYSAHDMEISGNVHKNFETLAKTDIENWVNQVITVL